MQYPLISEYVRAIQDASNNLDELAHLVPVQDDHGEPYRSSGAFAVVFKMKDEQTGKCYALKCFTEEQEGRAGAYRQIADELEFVDSSYITSVKYLDKEIFVDSSCEEDEFPVLLMDWIDGETMENYIAENYQDNYAMAMLCYRFCKMAAWLRSQPFAHGDIKPDNIMVRPDGSLTLVDYDGMFVPAMKGQKSPTIGTKDFSHPLRTVDEFDETIDDFALASIALSLKAISLKPSLLDEYGAADRLLFSADDYRDLSKSKAMNALLEQMNDEEVSTLLSMFLLANAKKNLAMCSFRLFVGKKPEDKIEVLSTEVTEEDLKNAVTDEYGVKYSKDGKKLLRVTQALYETYSVKENTQVICDGAFVLIQDPYDLSNIRYNYVRSIYMPNSVKSIGSGAFSSCIFLSNIDMPNSVISIGDYAFMDCSVLSNLVIPDGVISIGCGAFWKCNSLSSIVIPKSVKKMKGNPFMCWNGKLKVFSTMFTYVGGVLFDKKRQKIITCQNNEVSYTIPAGVTSIGEGAFENCKSLLSIILPNSVTSIGDKAFCNCSSLKDIVLPNGLTNIGDSTFSGCKSLLSIILPNSLISIGDDAFYDCSSLRNIVLPNGLTNLGDSTFSGCKSLLSIILPNSLISIGDDAFYDCSSLRNIVLPNGLTNLGDSTFSGCKSLLSIILPNSVTNIGNCAFLNCSSLRNIVLPNGLTSIGDYTFSGCSSLMKIEIPENVRWIGKHAFDYCSSLNVEFLNDKDEIDYGNLPFGTDLPLETKKYLISRLGEWAFQWDFNI